MTAPTSTTEDRATMDAALPQHVDVAVVGSGFSGLAMAVRLLRAGMDDFVVLERGHDVGGTWRDNSYPGCACDVPSHLYSFSFAPNPDWSSTFSPQEEIQAYLRRVARDQGVLPHVRFDCEVEEARWDDAAGRWELETSRGGLTARVVIAGAGPLHEPAIPSLPGLERFEGTVFHSARWRHDHDLTGKRVAVIGTGASAIQFVPQIQPRARQVHLFQRTAPWVMPKRARPITRVERALYRRLPAAQRLMRRAIYWGRELYAVPLLRAPIAHLYKQIGKAHVRRHISDPAVRRKVTPDYLPGCKRILISNDYLPSLTRPNVELVTEAISEVREHSIVTADGEERVVDTIIFGTGFHVTDMPIAERIRGRDGRTLAETWNGSPQAYRGTAVAGCPNLFLLLGPNTGSGHTSVVLMAEAQAGYAIEALREMSVRGAHAVTVSPDVQRRWNADVQRNMQGTVWLEGGCGSWYIDRNGLNTTLWPDFSFRFLRSLKRFDIESYEISAPAVDPDREPAVLAA